MAENRSLADGEQIRTLVSQRIEQEKAEIEKHQKQSEKATAFTSREILDALDANEDGDASLFIRLHRGRFCYDHAAGRWYMFNGTVWELDRLDQATASIQKVIAQYAEQAQREARQRTKAEKAGKTNEADQHKNKIEALYKRIRALQSKKRKENVLHLAKVGADSLGITGDEWDRDPWLLGCKNCVIDLKTGKHRPGRPEDYIKIAAPTEWKGFDAPCSVWEQFIKQIFNNISSLVDFVHRLLGYGLVGKVTHHIYPIFWGHGRNGKSTFLEAIKHVLGEYTHRAKSELLLEQSHIRSSGSANPDIMKLRGKRIVWCSETNENRNLNSARLKELVGGDTLNARALYSNQIVEFQPSHLLILTTNAKPHAPANDFALWQRILLIPFTLAFVENPKAKNERKADLELLDKLKAEAPGILAWLVRGCLAWQKEGLNPPESVRAATKAYQAEEDLIGHFINDRCVISENVQVKAGELYQTYRQWCEEMGHKPMSGTRFGKEMKERFDHYKGKNGIFYTGIGLQKGEG